MARIPKIESSQSEPVWVVQRLFLGASTEDDERHIVAVCSTSGRAYEIAAEVDASGGEFTEAMVEAYPLNEITKDD